MRSHSRSDHARSRHARRRPVPEPAVNGTSERARRGRRRSRLLAAGGAAAQNGAVSVMSPSSPSGYSEAQHSYSSAPPTPLPCALSTMVDAQPTLRCRSRKIARCRWRRERRQWRPYEPQPALPQPARRRSLQRPPRVPLQPSAEARLPHQQPPARVPMRAPPRAARRLAGPCTVRTPAPPGGASPQEAPHGGT